MEIKRELGKVIRRYGQRIDGKYAGILVSCYISKFRYFCVDVANKLDPKKKQEPGTVDPYVKKHLDSILNNPTIQRTKEKVQALRDAGLLNFKDKVDAFDKEELQKTADEKELVKDHVSKDPPPWTKEYLELNKKFRRADGKDFEKYNPDVKQTTYHSDNSSIYSKIEELKTEREVFDNIKSCKAGNAVFRCSG